AIQSAFYAVCRDVTQADELAALAADLGVDAATFRTAFDGDEARARVQAHFRQARLAGVRGFPTLILQQEAQLTPIASGCQPLDTVRAALDARLAA
ncbi:MAG: DsbA family protein, partial [Pseudomonadota bacterium]